MDKKRIGLYTKLFEYLLLLRKPFADFMYKHMKAVYDDNWWNNCVIPNLKQPFKKKLDDLDFYDLLRIFINQWKELYSSITGNNDINANDENYKLLFDILHLRNIVSHANENMIFIYDMHRQLSTLLDFAVFINAYEYIIVDLKNDLSKYTKEKDTNDERKKEKLLETIITNVLFPAMTCATLPAETKESILRTMVIIQNMKTADEILDFYSGALQSTKGQNVYKTLKEQNLTTFEDIRDKINAIMGNIGK
jgi:hypothetical protein